MKRLFTIAFVALAASLQINADSYHDALAKYIRMGDMIDANQYEQMMNPLVAQLYPNDAAQASAAFSDYISSQMMSDITDLYEPAFRGRVSEADLEELITLYSDPRFADMSKRAMGVVTSFSTTQEYAAFQQQFQAAFLALAKGKNLPADVSISEDIPAEYVDAFMSYYNDTKIDDVLMSSFRSMQGMLSLAMRKDGVAEPEKKIDALLEYVSRNMPKVLISIFYKTFTVEDLRLCSTVTATPAYHRAREATTEVAGNPIEMSISLFGKIADWMDGHHPQYAAPLRNLINDMKQLQQIQ